MSRPLQRGEAVWSGRDTAIYNLGIGFGAAAIADQRLLGYVHEERPTAFPTMACTLGTYGALVTDPASNIDFTAILHGEEVLELSSTLPPEGRLAVTIGIEGIWDKGEGRGAVMTVKRTFTDSATGAGVATIRSILMLRGNGGFGGSNDGAPRPLPVPDRDPDGVLDAPTLPEQALLYRLAGDLNPLHSDPAAARAAGFDRPILMGLCSFGVVGRTLANALGGELRALRNRFTGVIFPGETIRIDYWHLDDGEVAWRGRVVARDAIVLDGGRARFAPFA